MKRYEWFKQYGLDDVKRLLQRFIHEADPRSVYMFTRQAIEYWYRKECIDSATREKMIHYIAPLYRPL